MSLSDRFADYLEKQDRSRMTIRGYLGDLSCFARWFEQANGEELRADNITPTDVRLYREHLLSEKARPSTINRRLAVLRAFGRFLQDEGLVNYNIVGFVRGLKEQKAAPKWLDRREQAALTRELERTLAGAKTEPARRLAIRDRAAVVLMLNTGLRASEICDLDLQDVEISERKGQIRVRSGKGDKERLIPLNRTARAALKDWLEIRPEGPGGVWIGKRGEELAVNGLQVRLIKLARRTGIEATCHRLRHSFAKNLIDSGISLEKVSALLGHERITTTLIYVVPSQQDLEAAVGALD